jgi:hypothetical protein
MGFLSRVRLVVDENLISTFEVEKPHPGPLLKGRGRPFDIGFLKLEILKKKRGHGRRLIGER